MNEKPNTTYKLILPLEVSLSRTPKKRKQKSFKLNFNDYRNTFEIMLWKYKKAYVNLVWLAVWRCKKNLFDLIPPPYVFTYRYFHPNKGRIDLENPLGVIAKFTHDALRELGVIPDDDRRIIREIRYLWGGVDRDRPRAELTITHWEEKEPKP